MIATALSLILAGTPVGVKVDGDGYLRFVLNGRIVYSKAESLVVTNGVIASSRGPILTPTVRAPENASVRIGLDGTITVNGSEAGHIVLALFDSTPVKSGQFLVSATRAHLLNPGDGTAGVIRVDGEVKAKIPSGPKTLPVQASHGLVLKIAATTEVAGEHVLLGDLCKVADEKLAQTPLFDAPSIGVGLPLSVYRIEAALKQADIDATVEMPQNAVLYRKSQVIKREDFSTAAIAAVCGKLGVALPMSCTDLSSDYKAPAGEVELKSEGINSSSSSFSVTLGIYIDGKRVNSRTVNLRPDSTAVRIEANTSVKVVMKSAGLTVEINAKTRSAAFLGQTITVTTDTGSIVEGRVIGPDQVEVNV